MRPNQPYLDPPNNFGTFIHNYKIYIFQPCSILSSAQRFEGTATDSSYLNIPVSLKTTFTPSAGASQSAIIAMSLVNDTMPLVFQGSDLLMPAKPSLHAGSSRIPGHSGTFQTLGLFQPSGPFTPSYFLDLLSRSTAFFCISLLALQKCKIDTNLVLSQI